MVSKEQEKDLKRIVKFTNDRLKNKYRRGAIEHNGDLMDMEVIEYLYNALDETLDNLVYLIKAIKKIEEDSETLNQIMEDYFEEADLFDRGI